MSLGTDAWDEEIRNLLMIFLSKLVHMSVIFQSMRSVTMMISPYVVFTIAGSQRFVDVSDKYISDYGLSFNPTRVE